MNWKKTKIGGMACLAFVPTASWAQNVVIDAELRPRIEVRDGYKTVTAEGKDAGVFAIQRTRLGMTYTSGLLNAQVTLQDARTFGQYSSASSDATTGLFEAWAELLVVPGGTLKLGRQTLKYDDNRLFSPSAWSNTGTVHDLALFKYQLNDWQFHLGYAYNNSSDISSETLYANTVKYRSLGFAWFSKEVFKGLNLTALFVDEGVQDTVGVGTNYCTINMNHAYTYGGNLKYQSPDTRLNVLGTGYFQAGTNSKGKEMKGFLAAFKADYAFSKVFSAKVGADFISGDDDASDNKQSNFKKLYGTDHIFYGLMDYWDAAPDQGLLDYYGGIGAKVNQKLDMDAAFHVFNTDKALSSGGKDLGSEFDLILNYKLNPQTALQAGWCCYFKTDNTLVAKKITAGTETKFPQWAYVMLSIKPTFFNTAWLTK